MADPIAYTAPEMTLCQAVEWLARHQAYVIFERIDGGTTVRVTARRFTYQSGWSDTCENVSIFSMPAHELIRAVINLDGKMGS